VAQLETRTTHYGSYSIQYEEMDEAEEGRNPQLNFTLDFPGTNFGSGKYPALTE